MNEKRVCGELSSESHRLVFVHPFDAIAGSQRVGSDIIHALRSDGVRVKVELGFGTNGFLSKLDNVSRFSKVNKVRTRILLYPLWLLWMNLIGLVYLVRRDMLWANSVHAAPAVFLPLLFSSGRVIFHVHEIEFPKIYLWFLRFAEKRGATLLCVSDYHRQALGLGARVLYNCVQCCDPAVDLTERDELVFVGATSPAKGFSLFLDVVDALSTSTAIKPVAYLSDRTRSDPLLLERAGALGVRINFGETDTNVMYRHAFLSLVLSDPGICSETFSLVSVESISHLVPVGCAGMGVAREVLGEAQAFDVPDRSPQKLAEQVSQLWGDQGRYAYLIEACRVRRARYSFARFQRDVRHIAQL